MHSSMRFDFRVPQVRPSCLFGFVRALMSVWLGLWLIAAHAREPFPLDAGSMPVVSLQALPKQAQDMMVLIRQGGPFRYEKDGTVFGNRERLLPRAKRGYYREYTVTTPGVRHRGARRIVCGGFESRQPDACYYTEDHYASFRRMVE